MPARTESLLNPTPAIVWIVLALLCLLPAVATAQPDGEAVTLQLKWKHQFQFAGYYMALEKGYYTAAGLDVTIQPHNQNKSPVEVMLAGRADYAVTGSDIVIHRAVGDPVIALAAIFQHSAYGFLVRADSEIKKIEEFAGHRVMLGTGSQDAALHAALKGAGIKPSDITQIPSSFDVNSLIRGETDVFNAYVTDQRFHMEQAGVAGRYILPINYGVDFYGDILVTTEKEVKQHPERVDKFMRASLKGWEYALAHQDEAIALIQKKYNTQNMSYEHLAYEARATRELIQPLLVKLGHINPTRWEHIKTTLEGLGFIKLGSSIDGLIYKSSNAKDSWSNWMATYSLSTGVWILVIYIIILLLLLLKVHRQYRRRTEELAESERRLRGAQEYANIGHWVFPDGSYTEQWSDQVYRIFGLDPATPPDSKTLKTIMLGNEYTSMQNSIRNSLDTGKELNAEYRINRPDGKERWVECRGIPSTGTNGKPGQISGFIQDITRRKQTEEELRAGRDFAENLINMAQVIVLVLDPQGNIVRFNQYMEEISGYSQEEVTGKDWLTTFIPADNYEESKILFQATIKGSHTKGNINQILTKAGEKRDIEWYDKTIPDAEGKITGLLAIGQDITQRLQAEKEQKKLQSDLQRAQKMDAVGQLSGGIAHDFNNLLGIIIANLDILKDEVAGNGLAMRRHESALNAAMRGSDLTKRLLTFSSHTPMEAAPLNINNVVNGILDMIEKSITASIEVETTLADNLWLTTINPGDLEDSLINLVINARDAMPHEGSLHIQTANVTLNQDYADTHQNVKTGDYVQLLVSDNGVGIPKNILERIYEPFFTTKPQGQGTGLGLSMVYGFTQSANGHIEITSKPGQGTRIEILLPRSTVTDNSTTTSEQASSTNNKTILVVDDEKELVLIAKASLNQLGYRVLTAHSATEALKVLEQNQNIALMFSDIIMPGSMNGLNLAKEAKRQYPHLKILLTSGFTRDIDHEIFKQYEKDMLPKPYRSGEMISKISKLLNNTE
ncbi:MAG: ABC transporter substrate-binding protein [Gammaproteobacteria bacterium]|nr:ABC transporter substrate-binding protein [Gammaproteobacteria bacterium]